MYVDLAENCIRLLLPRLSGRYGIQAAVRKCVGEASYRRPALIAAERGGYKEINDFCAETLCSRGHSLYHDGQWFHVYCFRDAADAQKFLERFGGEKFDPAERGRCGWARWGKPAPVGRHRHLVLGASAIGRDRLTTAERIERVTEAWDRSTAPGATSRSTISSASVRLQRLRLACRSGARLIPILATLHGRARPGHARLWTDILNPL